MGTCMQVPAREACVGAKHLIC